MQQVIRDGVRLAYKDLGQGEPPILMVHCWTCNHTFFRPQIKHFSQRHRVIAVDLRGHGESDKPCQEYTVEGFADDLAWLCEQLGLQRPIVVGHSMGGSIALELAVRYPELPAAIVMVDSAIVPPAGLVDAVRALAESLQGPGYRDEQRRFMGDYTFLPTDDPGDKARIIDVMSSAPQHVMGNALEHHILRWNGAAAAAACTVP